MSGGRTAGGDTGLLVGIGLADDVDVLMVPLDEVEVLGNLVAVIAAELRVLKGSPTESKRNRPPPPSQQSATPSQQKSRGLEVTFSQGIRSLPPLMASAVLVRLPNSGVIQIPTQAQLRATWSPRLICAGASYSFTVAGCANTVVETDGTEPAAETDFCREVTGEVSFCEHAIGIVALGDAILCQDSRSQ